MLFFTISNLKSVKKYKSRRLLLSRKTFYLGISKLILKCSYSFHILCTTLSIVEFHTELSIFPFLSYWSPLSTVRSRDSFLFRKKSIICLLNVSAATAENKEQYTLINIIYIVFQNYYSFRWSFLWKASVLNR